MFITCKVFCLICFICLIEFKFVSSMAWTDEVNHKFTERCSKELINNCLKEFPKSDLTVPSKNFYWIRSKKNGSPLIEPVACQCEMGYRLMDLGSGIYPRYIPTGICKKTNCGVFHRCKPKTHQLRLLKKRNQGELDFDETFSEDRESDLPESLAKDWISAQVKVVIGCECKPIKLKNMESENSLIIYEA